MRLSIVLLLLTAPCLLAQGKSEFEAGLVHPKVVALQDGAQNYALYLPKAYDPELKWPLLLCFSPSAHGADAVNRHRKAAEAMGWIVAGSNVSKNGPAAPSQGAARAMFDDVTKRFSVAPDRIYSSGFSGGGVVAAWCAQDPAFGIVGAFLHARGELSVLPKSKSKTFYLLAPGERDFNFDESVRFMLLARAAGATAHLEIQVGGHTWASEESCVDMLRYAQLRADFVARKLCDAAKVRVRTEFDRLKANLDGPYPWLAYERLQELADLAATRSRDLSWFKREWKRVKKSFAKTVGDEKAAMNLLEEEGLFDGGLQGRYPSIESLESVDAARRRLLDEWSGSTAAELALVCQLGAHLIFSRIDASKASAEVKAAYWDFLNRAKTYDTDFGVRATELIKKKKLRRAVGALQHGLRLKTLDPKELDGRRFWKIKKLPAFERLLSR